MLARSKRVVAESGDDMLVKQEGPRVVEQLCPCCQRPMEQPQLLISLELRVISYANQQMRIAPRYAEILWVFKQAYPGYVSNQELIRKVYGPVDEPNNPELSMSVMIATCRRILRPLNMDISRSMEINGVRSRKLCYHRVQEHLTANPKAVLPPVRQKLLPPPLVEPIESVEPTKEVDHAELLEADRTSRHVQQEELGQHPGQTTPPASTRKPRSDKGVPRPHLHKKRAEQSPPVVEATVEESSFADFYK